MLSTTIFEASFPALSHHLSLTSNVLLDIVKTLEKDISRSERSLLDFSFHFRTMANVPAPGSLPGVRGVFDEERCRWFLHQIGDRIVPNNNFEHGIGEIYWELLYEYGRSQIADAISVFHELVEDESYEGDIWRSWRLGWRQRNVSITLIRYLEQPILTPYQG